MIMNEAHFSNISQRIINLLKEANHTIDIAMAWFTSAELFDALIKSLNKSIQVRLVLLDSPINFMEYAPDFNDFIKNGGKLYIASANIGFMHHKFCIIDGKVVISGSYNWTYYAETRNIENILISFDREIIDKYQLEFNRLINLITRSTAAPRLSLSEIRDFDDINVRDFNSEIETISIRQNKPIKRVFETQTQVIIKETERTPVSKWNIGILTEEGRTVPFIKAGTKLPYPSDTQSLLLDSKNEKSCVMNIALSDPHNPAYNSILMSEDIMRVANNTSNPNLKIQFKLSLDDTGMLRVDVLCDESHQTMTISNPSDKDLVIYE